MFTDLPEAALREFRSAVSRPDDFDAFWARTLAESRAARAPQTSRPFRSPLTAVEISDLEFSGFGGDRIRAWVIAPAGAADGPPLPAVVEYLGYGAGRGNPLSHLLYASAGFVHVVVDSRGQGAGRGQASGHTPDPHGAGPSFPGKMTAGIEHPDTYYYRRLIADAVLAVDEVRSLPIVDATRVGVVGGSQGGALAIAAAALCDDLRAAVAFVPFLSDVMRATTITNENPYAEIAHFLANQRARVEDVATTVAYVDGVNFARRAQTPVWYTVALMDPICPPSTVFASFNEYAGPKHITVWPYNGHEGGGIEDRALSLEVFTTALA
jgi:cephalosporin-C deacetylase